MKIGLRVGKSLKKIYIVFRRYDEFWQIEFTYVVRPGGLKRSNNVE